MDGAGGQLEPLSSLSPSRASTPNSHSHRVHHAQCGASSAPISQPPSSFLQQRIQQRRAEKKMSEGSLSNSTASARDEGIVTRSSSVRRNTPATLRPTPPNTDDDDLSIMGIKEIEKVGDSSSSICCSLLTPLLDHGKVEEAKLGSQIGTLPPTGTPGHA